LNATEISGARAGSAYKRMLPMLRFLWKRLSSSISICLQPSRCWQPVFEPLLHSTHCYR